MNSKRETVCAVVVTYNRKKLLLKCLESLLRQTYQLDAIYIIDNASADGTPQVLKEKKYIKNFLMPAREPLESENMVNTLTGDGNKNHIKVHYVRMNQNTGGAGGFNEGMKRAYGKGYDWMWLMDDDSEPKEDALEKLTMFSDRTDVAAFAGAVLFHSGEIFYGTRGTIDLNKTYPSVQKPLSPEAYNHKEVMIDAATFVNILVRSEAVGRAGYPRKELFIFNDDIEYCIRLRKEGKIMLITDSIVFHREPAKEGIEKRFLGKKALRIPYENFWLTYYQRRNLVWLGKEYSTSKINFYLGTINSFLRFLSGVLRFDDNKIKRIIFIFNAYIDGLRGNFDNEKPKKILYG